MPDCVVLCLYILTPEVAQWSACRLANQSMLLQERSRQRPPYWVCILPAFQLTCQRSSVCEGVVILRHRSRRAVRSPVAQNLQRMRRIHYRI